MIFPKSNLPISQITIHYSPKHRSIILFAFFLIILSFLLSHTTLIISRPQLIDVIHLQSESLASSVFYEKRLVNLPRWLEVICGSGTPLVCRKPITIGLVNYQREEEIKRFHSTLNGITNDIATIKFDSVSSNVTWKELFPEWIREDSPGRCPRIPMPEPRKYPRRFKVVVAKLPCGEDHLKDNDDDNNISNVHKRTTRKGIRDVRRLQVSLVTSRIIVDQDQVGAYENVEEVYVVFVGKCEPMVELFRCDDLIWHEGEYWVYKPRIYKLREMISMPFGTCHLALPYSTPSGSNLESQANPHQLLQHQATKPGINDQNPRQAYVTLLHSSQRYVCGAIALARSILQTNTTKDLVLLADASISNHSISGLQAAGWKIKRIRRIRSPNAKTNAYNRWNYSKLRVWQLVEYDKVMFIDSDFIVLRNIDHFFDYPQLSASPNNGWLFNSGIMILEPSECFFNHLMTRRYDLNSYNGGDQGYLNEAITWWHRLTRKLNLMKFFANGGVDRLVPKDRYTIHFLGIKPWTCYRDYDCNWDTQDHHVFASNDAHAIWWRVYDAMPRGLKSYCGMTERWDMRVRQRRNDARKANLSIGHWKIEVNDPRKYYLLNSS